MLATSSIQMARHANACKWSKRAVVLYRCAAAFWCAVERMSVDDLRYASEAYLRAAQIAVELAEQVRLSTIPTVVHHPYSTTGPSRQRMR